MTAWWAEEHQSLSVVEGNLVARWLGWGLNSSAACPERLPLVMQINKLLVVDPKVMLVNYLSLHYRVLVAV